MSQCCGYCGASVVVIVSSLTLLILLLSYYKHIRTFFYIQGNCNITSTLYTIQVSPLPFYVLGTPPFPSSASCLLVAPYQVIGNCLSSIDSSICKAASSTCEAWSTFCQASTNQLYLLDRCFPMLDKCLVLLGLCLSPCLISSCQSLDKEQQANRKRLTEMVV